MSTILDRVLGAFGNVPGLDTDSVASVLQYARNQLWKAGRIRLEIDEDDLREKEVRIGQRIKPWKRQLAKIVAQHLGCYPLAVFAKEKGFLFIGARDAPEVAAMTYQRCLLLCNKARDIHLIYLDTTKAQGQRQGNRFSGQWVEGLEERIVALRRVGELYTPETSKSLAEHLRENYPHITKRRYQNPKPKVTDDGVADWFSGQVDAIKREWGST